MTEPSPGGPRARSWEQRYRSQWGDVAVNDAVILHGADPAPLHDWASAGYATAEEYRFWSGRVCGLACLQMILAGGTQPVPTLGELVRDAVACGAFVPRDGGVGVHGLIYAPFVASVRTLHGLDAEVLRELPVSDLRERVPLGPVMASVSPQIRWPDTPEPPRGGHLVLVHDADQTTVTFLNPSGLSSGSHHARLDAVVFDRFFAHRGIQFHLPPRPPGRDRTREDSP